MSRPLVWCLLFFRAMTLRPFGFALAVVMSTGGCGNSPHLPTPASDASDISDGSAPDAESDVVPDAPVDDAPPAEKDGPDSGVSVEPPDSDKFCRASSESRPAMTVTLADGTIEGCAGLQRMSDQFHRTFNGVVRDDLHDPTRRNSLTIDTCGGGCNVVVSITGSIPFAIPVGALVEATYSFQLPFSCTQVLRISNLPEWNGQKNPVGDSTSPYLIISSGISSPDAQLAGTGITVQPTPLDCIPVALPPAPCGSGFLRSSALRFSHPSVASITVDQAEEASWSLSGQSFVVRNHRSFSAGTCDNWFDWGFTIAAR
jgi:hypothetical protein